MVRLCSPQVWRSKPSRVSSNLFGSEPRRYGFYVECGMVGFALVSRCSSIGLKGQSPLKRAQGALAPFVLSLDVHVQAFRR